MRHLREVRLLWIRTGPGALILPKEVSKISLEFHEKIEGGHRGAKKFWRTMLPRIKYRNPSVPIQITRHKNPSGPATLNIFTKPTPSSAAAAAPTTPTHSVDIKEMPELEVLAQLVSRTGAVEIQMTEEEKEQWREIEAFNKRSEADRKMVRERLEKEREDERILKLARGEITE
ncbi:hypothetical protein BU24DRAFT_420009 [Aaosphaeria arxii CBS 175.79]|uniref:Ribosomal protein/NADH dehydrogenase domain-containing protein n=1 Tax=Aaosphaeria arxii CBS 175.79 TaxID=1450172 RepID=A0A6A5XWG3_9PLEO|nr:uncharacterized protein BU24DRAFT_420009 [Aaosphaeria arxii CBS 175.79]KAF2016970.1 hypothetical protein BU24DRAFT_420009 [Aaosphaeria arxii CBS 175.79]